MIRRGILAGALTSAMLLAPLSGPAQKPPSSPPIVIRGGPEPAKLVPKFEVVAETRLLMEGLANSNLKSLQRLLREKPPDLETWVFARGQAILIAETGNLLLLRPPRNVGRDTWMKLAMEMRSQAATLARSVAARDHAAARRDLLRLTESCNRCHTTFKIPARAGDAPPPTERDL
jgi:hypothetical protein